MNCKFLKDKLTLISGLPGSGKTTFAAVIVDYCKRKGFNCFTNFSCKGAYELPHNVADDDFPDGSWLIIDEAGLVWGNRDFKNFSKELIEFFKLYRHHQYTIILLSQSLNDVDLKIRKLASQFFEVQKTLFSFINHKSKLISWFRCSHPPRDRKDVKTQVVAEDDMKVWLKNPTFFNYHITCKRFSRKKYYKMFDSYAYIPTARSVAFKRW